MSDIFYLLNWLDLDKVAPGGMLGLLPPNDLLGDSKSVDMVSPCPNFFGDSRVLWPLLGEGMGEFWLLEDWYKWGKDWLKSMVTFRKKSQTERFRPKSLADLYLKLTWFRIWAKNLCLFFTFLTRMRKYIAWYGQVQTAHTLNERNSIFRWDSYGETWQFY